MSLASPGATTALTIQFMDVGQGDATYIEFPDGTTMLVDFGSKKNKRLAGTDAIQYFRNHTRFKDPKRRLDYLVLTHGDQDHYNLVNDFLRLQPVIGNLLYSGHAQDYGPLISSLETRHLFFKDPPINVLHAPHSGPFLLGTFGGAMVRVLAIDAPSPGASADWRKNTGSVVLQIEFATRRVILSGDATVATEQYILTTSTADSLKSLALKVGHHGSTRTSIRPSWIAAVSPEFVFISADRSGTLGEGEASTGYRLPQELAIDIIRDNTTLDTDVAAHRYFSSYDPADYAGYVNPDNGAKGFTPKHTGPRDWLNPTTTEAVYTSLSTLDLASGGTVGDQGVQYELLIRSDEFVDVTSTEP